jgi:hypothetical protein
MGFMLADERYAWLCRVKARSKKQKKKQVHSTPLKYASFRMRGAEVSEERTTNAGPFDSAEVRFAQDDRFVVGEDAKNNR